MFPNSVLVNTKLEIPTHTDPLEAGVESAERFQKWLLGFPGFKREDYWIMAHT